MGEDLSDKPVPGSSPETSILLTDEELARMLSSEDIKDGEKLIGGGEGVVYVESATPRTIEAPDGSKPEFNIWGVNVAARDYGTRVEAMGRFLRNEDGSISVISPPTPETLAPGEV
jgi:hypothetical protein